MPSNTRTYTKLTEADWSEAAEKHARGMTHDDLAAEYGVSVRSVATHLPAALERRRKALAASTGGTAATSTSTATVLAALPLVSDRAEATAIWRQQAWADSQALATRLRSLTAEPAPDAKAIRAISAAAAALSDLVKLGGVILEVDRHAADQKVPELIVRELSEAEVAAIRQDQRDKEANGGADLDADDLAALGIALDEPEDHAVVIEGDDTAGEEAMS